MPWQFLEGAPSTGVWYAFDAAAEAAVEAAHSAGQQTAQSAFFNPRVQAKIDYDYDLARMVQVNRATGYTRTIRRVTDGAAAARAEGAAPAPAGAPSAGAPAGGSESDVNKIDEQLHYTAPNFGSPHASFEATTKCTRPALSELAGNECSICMSEFEETQDEAHVGILMGKCRGHYFHLGCVDRPEIYKEGCIICPNCKQHYGVRTGVMPEGVMLVQQVPAGTPDFQLHGFTCGTIFLQYAFHSGTQRQGMPEPGNPYSGTQRFAFLPDNDEGREVCAMLKIAFRRGLLFKVGESITTGRKNTVVWGHVHHKTNPTGGPALHGFPDPDFFRRVKLELADVGVTPADIGAPQ